MGEVMDTILNEYLADLSRAANERQLNTKVERIQSISSSMSDILRWLKTEQYLYIDNLNQLWNLTRLAIICMIASKNQITGNL